MNGVSSAIETHQLAARWNPAPRSGACEDAGGYIQQWRKVVEEEEEEERQCVREKSCLTQHHTNNTQGPVARILRLGT